MSQPVLIQIAVGPVQEFIASGRKLRDLWFGSYLLSELSKATAKSLAENGCELIFPAVTSAQELAPNNDLIVANKVLAVYRGEKAPQQLAAEAKAAWRALLNALVETTLNKINSFRKDYPDLSVDTEVFKKQMADIGEFFAVWTPIAENKYAEARSRVEQLLAGRKNLREFEAPSWPGAGRPKNSLDGLRESVFKNPVEIPGIVKHNEHLDAVGCIKRFYPLSGKVPHPDFEDLAYIAVKPWQKAAEKQGQRPPAVGPSKDFETSEDFFNPDLAGILKPLTSNKEIGQPTKYACILLGDGDKMGVVISEINTIEGHKQFSSKLSKFASRAKELVEDHEGSLVYAGGDDVLAYIPLHTVVECTDVLRKEFQKLMGEVCKSLALKSEVPTFSIGLSIVHYQEPLSAALNTVRLAEKTAKNKGGRNALAVILDKRSGAPITISGKWDKQGELPGLAERLQNWVVLYKKQEDTAGFSARLGYQLREARLECGDKLKFEVQGSRLRPQNAAAAFVLRIFRQKEAFRSFKEDKQHEWEIKLFQGYESIRTLADELVLAHQLALLPVYGKE